MGEINKVLVHGIERLLFKVIRKHGIYQDLMKDRNNYFESCGAVLISGHMAGEYYAEVRENFPAPREYKMRLKLFDNFITEYLQTMKLGGVSFTEGAQINAIISDFADMLRDNGIGFDVELGEKFYETMRKRFLTDR
jgi:hypothetical protein